MNNINTQYGVVLKTSSSELTQGTFRGYCTEAVTKIRYSDWD